MTLIIFTPYAALRYGYIKNVEKDRRLESVVGAKSKIEKSNRTVIAGTGGARQSQKGSNHTQTQQESA